MGILNKITNGFGVAVGLLALLFMAISAFLFKAWSKSKRELEREQELREFENSVTEKNNEAIENIQIKKKEQEVEDEKFKEDVDDAPSILDAIELHNDRVQSTKDK